MNIERINLLADTIEQHRIKDLGFNMMAFAIKNPLHSDKDLYPDFDRSGHSCGTVACIGGHAVALAHADWSLDQLVEADDREEPLHREARDWLGLTQYEADVLFYGFPHGVQFSHVTPAMAVKTLRHLAATGVVDWNEANEVQS